MPTDIPDTPARRDFLRGAAIMSGAGILSASLAKQAATAEATGGPAVQPTLSSEQNTSDIVVETLIAWRVPFVFGMVGDGINPMIEALRKRQDRIRYVGVRQEEAAAFMASGYPKYTGKLGVCLATTGPGPVHLMMASTTPIWTVHRYSRSRVPPFTT